MLHDEWFSSLSIKEFIASQEDAHGTDPYRGAAEIIGVYPDIKRKVIMRLDTTKWELFLKEGRAAMRQTCASPWGEHLVRCAEYMYGIPPQGWQITKREKIGKRTVHPERSRESRAESVEELREEAFSGD